MTKSTSDNLLWSVTFIYEGGPRDGQREGRNMREDPQDLQFVDDVGGKHAYTITDRQIDRAARTAVLSLHYGTAIERP